MSKIYQCRRANSTPLNIIGEIKLEVKVKSIKTYTTAYVASNLIISILLGNDWINSNHVHLFGDQNQLTIPDQYGQLISIPYLEPTGINYPALLINQITLPPHSQTLVNIICQIDNAYDLIFEPYKCYISKFIFIPHAILNVKNNQTKVLLINANDDQQTLSKNTRIGTIARHSTYTIYTTTQNSFPTHDKHIRQSYFKSKPRAVLNKKRQLEYERIRCYLS
ncbi:unnamed protein product [Rotaria sp. Silwood2]|nr:unnamed protein product [Rotaria sp. Silwood2]